jgi:RNA polymerase sigma-70 factor (ECF subfamily)
LKSIRKQRPAGGQAFDIEVEHLAVAAPEVDEIDREQLAVALAELTDEFRIVVLMFYFEELSYQEIAKELAIPIGTVMSRLSRAKGHLRTRLSPPANNVSPAPRAADTANTAGQASSGTRTASSSTRT